MCISSSAAHVADVPDRCSESAAALCGWPRLALGETDCAQLELGHSEIYQVMGLRRPLGQRPPRDYTGFPPGGFGYPDGVGLGRIGSWRLRIP